MDWSDQDVENAARHLLERHGAVSRLRALKRSRKLDLDGEAELAAVWARIAEMIIRVRAA